MGQLTRQNKGLFVGALCVAAVCVFWTLYFPDTLVTVENDKEQPNVLLLILVPIFFGSVLVAMNTELRFLGFQKNRLPRIIFSTLFALSAVNVAICRLFTSTICLLVGREGMWRLVPFILYGLLLLCFFVILFGFVVLEVIWRKRRTGNNSNIVQQ